ncbi:MAG: hypothetical protein ACOY93_02820 [Bacillota bacterium]
MRHTKRILVAMVGLLALGVLAAGLGAFRMHKPLAADEAARMHKPLKTGIVASRPVPINGRGTPLRKGWRFAC